MYANFENDPHMNVVSVDEVYYVLLSSALPSPNSFVKHMHQHFPTIV